MRRLLVLALLAVILLGSAGAESPEMWIEVSGNEVMPGNPVIVSMMVPHSGFCNIRLLDTEGRMISAVALNRPVSDGFNSLYWNGTWEGVPAPEGIWRLEMEIDGETAETEVTVGRMAPCLISPILSETKVIPGREVIAAYFATEPGDLTISVCRQNTNEPVTAIRVPVEAGEGEIPFTADVSPGDYQVILTLTRADGVSSVPVSRELTVETPAVKFSPASDGSGTGEDLRLNGWTVPMDITDEDAVWQALTAPVTIVDDGKSTDQRRQIIIRKEPDDGSEGVGVMTLISQGVHVLERGGEWSLIECYSSSFHNSAILNWNMLVRGYVPTQYLREVTPSQQIGMVVDKLTQRMYIFMDGKLFTTLLVSTGAMNPKQPYNETRSGEYLLVSKVGGFNSDNYYCPLAIRFNAGDMLHEVPYVQRNMDYSGTEPKLGTRASHGCIRVQRKANPDGVNMQWIWNHYQQNTKLLIWEDWQGRQIPLPEDEALFYCNLRRNNYYHSEEDCPELGTRNPGVITYAELSGEAGAKLKPCPYCGPAAKKEELEAVNILYAEGGDHEPEMTKARENCPRARQQER